MIKKYVFYVFIILSFVISWTGWLILILTNTEPGFFNPWKLLAAFGPSVVGLFAIYTYSGRDGLRKVWKQLIDWSRPKIFWYVFSLAGPPLAMLASLGFHIILGGEGLTFNDPAEIYRVIPVFFLVLIFSVLGEEVGWRGFALSWLQERFNAFQSSLILGVIWALWHLPLFWISGDFHQQLPISWFIIQTITLTFIYTWIFNATNQSLLIILLFHAASNTAFGVLPMLPELANGSTQPAWILVILQFAAVCLLLLINGPKTLTKRSDPLNMQN